MEKPSAGDVPGSVSPEEGKKKRGLLRKKKDAPHSGDEDDDGDMDLKASGKIGSKLHTKKVERQEKKERKEQRKEMKKNSHFDFIEANEPANLKKKDLKQKKKEDAAMFNFTEENKHLQGQTKVTRQMVRQAKHMSGPPGGASGKGAAAAAEKEAAVSKKKMSKVDLDEFLLRHPMHRMRGTTWHYMHIVKSAPGAVPVQREQMVVLGGGGVRVEAFFELLEALSVDFEVLAPMLPRELTTFEDYEAGLDLLRSALHVKQPFHLVGVALGGMVALEYAQQHPKRLSSLVLSHTAPPNAEFGALCARYASKLAHHHPNDSAAAAKADHTLPSSLTRALLGHHVHSKDLARDAPSMLNTEGLVRFWKKTLRRFQLDSGSIQAKMEAMAKHHQETHYDASSFQALECPVLLLDSERGDAFSQRSWDALKELLPQADADMWKGHGALANFVRGEQVANTILKWMTEKYFSHQSL